MRYCIGVDWADQEHAVWVSDEAGRKVTARGVPHTAEGLSEWGQAQADTGTGPGDLPGDIQGFTVGTPDISGQLRAERADTGPGRVYRLTYSGMDTAGNVAQCQASVTVPHDQGN